MSYTVYDHMRKFKVLVACEYTGLVREAFAAKGWDAWSCDLLPTEIPGNHIQGDAIEAVYSRNWDLLISHPPCTYLSSSGMHWTTRGLRDPKLTEEALEFVKKFLDAPIEHIALENPVGCISTRIRKYDQAIQPYHFGSDASKKTCFWLKNLPPLSPTEYVPPRMVNGKPRWSNQTDSGQNKLAPSSRRGLDRARTYPGVAEQMAVQWSKYIENYAKSTTTGTRPEVLSLDKGASERDQRHQNILK